MKSIVLVLSVVALLAFSAPNAQAGRYRRASIRTPRVNATRCVYPRVRQINGKTLWDLGKKNGQWPSL